MKRKDVIKKLAEIAKELPEDGYPVEHKYAPNTYFNEEEQPLKGYFEQHLVSHKRRLKRCYDLGGWPLVERYLNHYGLKLEYRE